MINTGVISIGVKAPIIKEGDNLESIVIDSVDTTLNELNLPLQDGDIIGITESVVARSFGTYCTLDEIKEDLSKKYYYTDTIVLFEPIASRNRFSFILQAISQSFKHVILIWKHDHDEVGNILFEPHPFTGINYYEYYKQIITSNGATFAMTPVCSFPKNIILDCRCHVDQSRGKYTLADICNSKSQYGVLGSNLCGERLKLFPINAQEFVENLALRFEKVYKKHIDVIVYGDGCFKDPVGGIWEFADPVTCPGTTISWDKTPNELKLKVLAETQSREDIQIAIDTLKSKNESSLGTTPRRINDLLASLMDLTSGSGDKGTPIIVVKNYFNHYGN